VNATLGVAQGVVPGRFMARAVPQVSYSAFNPVGPPFFDPVIELYVGGQFWDGRAATLEEQARAPFLNPNEMNNLTQNVPDPAMVVQKVATGPSAARFREVFGAGVFGQPTEVVFGYVAQAIAAYERSSEVSPFSSKYDAWRAGRATLSASELNGLRLATGSWTGRPDGAAFPRFAHCVDCHMVPTVPSGGRDLWTNTCYQNIGVPRNPRNPFYSQTDPVSNPVGYNPQGAAFLDYGLGTTFYTRMGLPPGNVGPGSNGQGDFLGVNGQFKAPSLRNVDLRTRPGFVKAYMHNGVFTSLEQVVHFYNTRNLTTHPGEVIDFTRANPYAGLRGRPLWDTPEYASAETLVNAVGALGTDPGTGQGGESGAQVGNLGITGQEERDIVAFLRTLSDGYFDPDTHGACVVITSQPVSQQACPGSSASFTVASSVPKALGYQWRRNGVPIAGADTSYYWIVSATLVDAGEYDCIVKAECGSVTSRAATLSVCAADFNCDGRVDAGDFTAFLAAYHAHDPAADLNGDGVVDVRDFVAFQHAMQTGC
jgi:cytochrome c peroxidase